MSSKELHEAEDILARIANLSVTKEAIPEVVTRLDTRAKSLKSQAYFLLGIIVSVLIIGAILFVFSNYIATASLGVDYANQLKQAQDMYQSNNDQISDNTLKISKLNDNSGSVISGKYVPEITEISNKIAKIESEVISNCKGVSESTPPSLVGSTNVPNYNPTPIASGEHAGQTFLNLSTRTVFFERSEDGNSCSYLLREKQLIINPLLRQLQTVFDKRATEYNTAQQDNASKTKPLQDVIDKLTLQQNTLATLIQSLQLKSVAEKVGGKALDNEKVGAPISWQEVVQTNSARLGSLIIPIFLVSILVPQYRYNLKLSAYYEARADVLKLASDFGLIAELLKLMTPAIDFGRPPRTPFEQIVTLAKTLKKDE